MPNASIERLGRFFDGIKMIKLLIITLTTSSKIQGQAKCFSNVQAVAHSIDKPLPPLDLRFSETLIQPFYHFSLSTK
jgi:hypothetical protein